MLYEVGRQRPVAGDDDDDNDGAADEVSWLFAILMFAVIFTCFSRQPLLQLHLYACCMTACAGSSCSTLNLPKKHWAGCTGLQLV
jgi:hypothetical protein